MNTTEQANLKSKTVIIFNEAGKEVSSSQRTADGKLISGVDSAYDEKGNVIERHYKDFYSKIVRINMMKIIIALCRTF